MVCAESFLNLPRRVPPERTAGSGAAGASRRAAPGHGLRRGRNGRVPQGCGSQTERSDGGQWALWGIAPVSRGRRGELLARALQNSGRRRARSGHAIPDRSRDDAVGAPSTVVLGCLRSPAPAGARRLHRERPGPVGCLLFSYDPRVRFDIEQWDDLKPAVQYWRQTLRREFSALRDVPGTRLDAGGGSHRQDGKKPRLCS
jgi:hypothetical protein